MRIDDRIQIVCGDITDEAVDAIVNAANTDLWLGAGVAGAIKRRGGPSIQEECNQLSPIALGGAVLTNAGNLPAKHIIHAAVMRLGAAPTAESLRAATLNSLQLAAEYKFEVIGFPALGTGVGGFGMEACAGIMIGCVEDFLAKHQHPQKVRFILFDKESSEVFNIIFNKHKKGEPIND